MEHASGARLAWAVLYLGCLQGCLQAGPARSGSAAKALKVPAGCTNQGFEGAWTGMSMPGKWLVSLEEKELLHYFYYAQ